MWSKGETFGTKKAKAAIKAQERNRVDIDAMTSVTSHIQGRILENTSSLPSKGPLRFHFLQLSKFSLISYTFLLTRGSKIPSKLLAPHPTLRLHRQFSRTSLLASWYCTSFGIGSYFCCALVECEDGARSKGVTSFFEIGVGEWTVGVGFWEGEG